MFVDDYDEVDDLVKSLRYRLDKVQFELYDQFRTKQRQLRPIEIITDHTNKNSPPKTYGKLLHYISYIQIIVSFVHYLVRIFSLV